jgi:hypothetical protein
MVRVKSETEGCVKGTSRFLEVPFGYKNQKSFFRDELFLKGGRVPRRITINQNGTHRKKDEFSVLE